MIAKRARGTTSVHGLLHHRGHELTVSPNTRSEVHGPIELTPSTESLSVFLKFLKHIRHHIRVIEHVKVYDARCESQGGALVHIDSTTD